MSEGHTLTLQNLKSANDPRLGRHINHDSRSLRFRAPAKDPRKLSSIKHEIFIGLMDQGDEGSCTGHGGWNNMCSGLFWTAAKAAMGTSEPHVCAVDLYCAATAIDPWPGTFRPDDTGSDGLSVAKVLQSRGLISGYQHATSLEATLTALARQVVMLGTSWMQGMYDVSPEGQITPTGQNWGGHEYVLDELDVPNRRAWMRNSWGEGFGIRGRAWMTWDDLGKLLADQGDCTVLVPLALPPPEPAPEPPQPSPAAARELAASLRKFVPTKGCPLYLKQTANNWLKENP